MSNSRKARGAARHDRPAPAQQARHMAWARHNAAELDATARACFTEQGRAAIFVRSGDEWSPGSVRARYITDAMARELAGGWPDPATARMVASYDPARQFILIVDDPGGTTAYKIRLVPIGRG